MPPEPAAFAEDQRKNPPPSNWLDRLLRRFARASYGAAVLLLYVLAATALGLALAPALWTTNKLLFFATDHAMAWGTMAAWALRGFAVALAWFIFGLALMIVVPVYNFVLPTRYKAFKGGYYTLAAVPWFLHNGLFYLVRFTFLPFATLTPFGVWFLKAMGMRIGRHAFVNTELISDPRFLTIGDDAALGGSVRIFAHYGGGGNLVIAPVKIGNRATLGAGACVMGDVEVGDGATVLPHSVLLPGTRVPAGETWGGVPARRISRDEMEAIKTHIRGLVDLG
jgi:acetyltransferase-like isoleucine patch superfamily enzyme